MDSLTLSGVVSVLVVWIAGNKGGVRFVVVFVLKESYKYVFQFVFRLKEFVELIFGYCIIGSLITHDASNETKYKGSPHRHKNEEKNE